MPIRNTCSSFLVKFVHTKEEALQEGKRILEATKVQLLVEAAVDKEKEIYLSITGDPVPSKAASYSKSVL